MSRTLIRPRASRACIGFRLDEDSSRELASRAAKLDVSTHELARFYVLQVLQEDQERTALHDAIKGLHRQLIQQQQDFSLAVEALLASAGKASPTEARTWVHQNLE